MRVKIYLLFIAFSLFAVSCKLDLTPPSEISEEAFYKTSDEINEAIIGVYNGLQAPVIYEWALTELRSDNTQMNKENSISVYTEYRELDAYTVTSQNSLIDAYWEATYHDINLANQVLEQTSVVGDSTLKLQYEGECHFIRAHHYFNLVRLFGPVPLVTNSISGEEAKAIFRTEKNKIYSFIENELSLAVAGLPDNYDESELGRVTSWAAMTLLAKVYLTEQKYSEASVLLEKIINDSPYSLLDNYEDVFNVTNEMNNEIIFAVRFMSGSVGLGNPFANTFAPRTSGDNVVQGDGDGLNYPTDDIISAFTSIDARKDVCLQEGYYDEDKGIYIEYPYINKFMDNVVEIDDAENDWPVLRYADVLLMYAEALNEVSGASIALPYLNDVRERAKLAGYTSTEISNKYDMRIALGEERRLEFAFENHRYFDLLRTNSAVSVINEHFQTEAYYNDPSHPEYYVSTVQEWQTLLPIPQREIDINPDLTQNIGY